MAATFVYVSNAEDGDIGVYGLAADGALKAAGRVPAGKPVGPLATSPDKKYLFAAVRAKPFTVHTFGIDPASGALQPLSTGALAESFPFITTDRSGRWLLGASYGGHLVSVNPIGGDGKVGDPIHVIPTARNAHAVLVDNTNKYVYVPHLGTDQVFQFVFDEESGELAPNTPPLIQLGPGTGPRHLRVSADNRFVYVLNELTATVTTLSIDSKTGQLAEVSAASALPPDTKLRPGVPRGSVHAPQDLSNDIWASDLHLTPNGRFLYAAERTGSSLGAFSVDGRTGKLTYLGSTFTELQPRGFAIDPSGKYLIASGERSQTLSVHAIDATTGSLALLGKYPTGKGSNWVEIVLIA